MYLNSRLLLSEGQHWPLPQCRRLVRYKFKINIFFPREDCLHGLYRYAEDLDLGFISPDAYTTPDIICHKNAAPGAATATAAAGSTIVFSWGPGPWPHPYGPILTYVAQCSGSCTTVDKTSLRWVKIQESGINYNTQVWAQQDLINQGSKWTVKIPSSLKPGNYVFRNEILAYVAPFIFRLTRS